MNDYEDVCYEDSVSSETDDYQSHGWPGDGGGEDDLADYNQNEADDYRHEGAEDSHLEMEYEDRNGCGYEADGFDY